jgi:hypothetical protein
MINKPFDQIVAADIAELCEHGAYESLMLEFKRELIEPRRQAPRSLDERRPVHGSCPRPAVS